MGKKQTLGEVKDKIFKLVGEEYYVNEIFREKNDTKVNLIHIPCTHQFSPSLGGFLRGKRCPNCFGTLKKTTESFSKEVSEKTNNEYTVIGEYINSRIEVLIKHNLCNTVYLANPSSFLFGIHRCSKCRDSSKRNTDSLKEEIYKLTNGEYTILGEFINTQKKILIRHDKCEYEYEVNISSFLSGSRCARCAGLIKKTQEEFQDQIKKMYGKEYTVVGEYSGTSKKVKIKHNTCGSEFTTYPPNILKGHGCAKCAGNLKRTTESFKQEVFSLVGNEYSVLGNYKNSTTKINIKHEQCGFEYLIAPNTFINSGVRCSKCYGKMKRSIEEFKDLILKITKGEYVVIGNEYNNSESEIEFLHTKCGYEFSSKPSNFLRTIGCPKCDGYRKKDTSFYKMQVYDMVKDEYYVVGEYVNTNKKILMKHNICESIYSVTPSNFLKNRRCPICSESKGEQRIRKFLEENEIKFQREYEFIDCINKKPLPFDFAIFNEDYKIDLLIEFDGEFHYYPIMGVRRLKYHKFNDGIKTKYCFDNNIYLIRIPYWDFDRIEEILTTELIKLNIEIAM